MAGTGGNGPVRKPPNARQTETAAEKKKRLAALRRKRARDRANASA